MNHNLSVIILAAGLGTRMKSEKAKVLHEVLGKPLLFYSLDRARELNPEKIIVVLGHQFEEVYNTCQKAGYEFEVVRQNRQLGTAHAVLCVIESNNLKGTEVLIMPGDCPLIKQETLTLLYNKSLDEERLVTVLGCRIKNPAGYGRIIFDKNNEQLYIVEEKDASTEEKAENLINSSIYHVQRNFLETIIGNIKNSNVSGEFYLTDIVREASLQKKVGLMIIDDESQITGVNSRVELAQVTAYLQREQNLRFMKEGVTLVQPDSIFIEDGAVIGKDTVIYPNVYIKSKCRIGKGCTILSNSFISGNLGDYIVFSGNLKSSN